MRAMLKINEPEQFSSGLWVDPPENQPALWKDGENVLFSDGIIEKSKGYSAEQAYAEDVIGLAVANANGLQRMYVGTETKVYVRDGGAQTQIGSGFNPLGLWSFETFGTFLLATNNVDKPKIWKNTGQLVDWGPLARAAIVRKIQVFPVLFSGQEVHWPAYNNIEEFTIQAGNRAGNFFIRDLDGDVLAVEPMGDYLIYYTADMFGFMSFVGGENPMSFKTNQGGGIGAVGPNSVIPVGPFHFGMSRKGIWQSDGNSFNYIARPAIARWINSQIDWTKAKQVVGVHHETEQQVAFFFPCLDGQIRGVGYTYEGPSRGRWTILKMPILAAGKQGVFKAPPIGVPGSMGFYNTGNNAGGDPLVASLRSAPLDMGSTDRMKRWQMVEIHSESVGLFEMRVGYSDLAKAEPEWLEWAVVEQENWLEDRESNFLTLEFRSLGFGAHWELSGLEIYGEPVGKTK